MFGDEREAAVCRELTKTYEEIRRGPLAELAQWAADGVKGEITLVVGGAPERTVTLTPEDLAAEVAAEEACSRRDPQGRDPGGRGAHRDAAPDRLRRRRRRQDLLTT